MEAIDRNLRQDDDFLDLQKYWSILKRRWLPASLVTISTIGLTGIYSARQTPIYEARARLLLQTADGAIPFAGFSGGSSTSNTLLANEAAIIRSLPIGQQVIERLDIRNADGTPMAPQNIVGNLKVYEVPNTHILELTYQSTDPEEAARVVDSFMEVYRDNDVRINRSEAAAAREFIEEQLPLTERSVREAEEALRRFKERNRIIVLNEEAQTTVRLLGSIDEELVKSQTSLNDTQARIQELSAQLGLSSAEALAASALTQSRAVRDALESYQSIESELAVAESRYQPQHPAIVSLVESRDALRQVLNERIQTVLSESPAAGGAIPVDVAIASGTLQLSEVEIQLTGDLVRAEVDRLGTSSRLSSLQREREAYQSRASVLPRLEQGQRELERQLNAAQSTYEALLQRLQEVRVTENQNLGNARVVENALVPINPIWPRMQLILMAGGIVGALIGTATAITLDVRDQSLKTVQEAKNRLGYVMLGSIPLFGRFNRPVDGTRPVTLPVRDYPRSSMSEAFRMLQANLKFSTTDRKLKVVAVTSSIPREGKSTVSANLGVALAELGNRVLVIDADMRRPSQHQVWELANTTGLSNVLVEQLSVAEIAHAEGQDGNKLDVLTAGVIPPNPVALLDSQRMTTLLDEAKHHYDYIIIDTPPLAVAADALILGKVADGVLLVVRPGIVNVTNVDASREALERARQPVVGMVVNGVIPANEPDSYYYYYAQGYYTEGENQASKKRNGFLQRLR
ncbi:uncharacterized protein involved in exopolysaccharide biosynthesis [Rubidibacter lacunae KORDI 51-2]|uniref:non-specific protein-tyrosine kinase n=1 Tax=Rubidibacter lacunae KORDI 51-2 TaxID=582515 RepID=U5DPF5_9CHRO|nr:polysaccharide biosynthesis tyrosine autokinase [Rubidibacter lacunae]ERN42732.1 uncharacterized protein involved in exopolysaccharide biosynthesis [Rubidibacter lacunae KORDI 51-2]